MINIKDSMYRMDLLEKDGHFCAVLKWDNEVVAHSHYYKNKSQAKARGEALLTSYELFWYKTGIRHETHLQKTSPCRDIVSLVYKAQEKTEASTLGCRGEVVDLLERAAGLLAGQCPG